MTQPDPTIDDAWLDGIMIGLVVGFFLGIFFAGVLMVIHP